MYIYIYARAPPQSRMSPGAPRGGTPPRWRSCPRGVCVCVLSLYNVYIHIYIYIYREREIYRERYNIHIHVYIIIYIHIHIYIWREREREIHTPTMYIYIYIYIIIIVWCVCLQRYQRLWKKRSSSGEEDPRDDRLSEHQIRGWRAVSATTKLQGKGLPERNICFPQAPASLTLSEVRCLLVEHSSTSRQVWSSRTFLPLFWQVAE